ncbi:MAG: ATP-dependent helicase [Elusimicrobiota bacterium]|jgi:superfamily I DNA/RNA helicase
MADQNLAARIWSPQQLAVFSTFLAALPAGVTVRPGARHVIVRARAGTGKTSTMVELVHRVVAKWGRKISIVACSFGRKIADELIKRMPVGVNCNSLHGLGFGCQNALRRTRLDKGKDQRMAETACDRNTPKDVIKVVEKLAALGKDCAPLAQSADDLEQLQLDYDLIGVEDDISEMYTPEWIRVRAYRAMLLALEFDGTCSYSDMVYVTVRLGLAKPLYDMVLVDEAQDMNAGQLLLATMLCKPNGRIVIIGDDRQGIFRFRGADSSSLDRLKAELNADELGLTITYRCPKAVVAMAKQLVPDFCAADDAPEGIVDGIAPDKLVRTAQPGDFVLSRTNAPLVTTCLRFAAHGVPARVSGRNVGQGLVNLIGKAHARTLDEVETYLAKWADKQLARCAKLSDAGAEKLAEEVEDKQAALAAIIAEVDDVDGLVAKIESLFSDDESVPAVVLSTVHRAKGLEAQHVFLLESSFRQSDDLEEENIRYVAITRAMHHLTLVGSRPAPKSYRSTYEE